MCVEATIEAQRTFAPLTMEYRVLDRDGRTLWIRDASVHVLDESGNPLYVQGFFMDVTERVQNEQAQAALRSIAETASAAEDMPSFYAEIHRIVGELMYADNFFIAIYDEARNALSFPYYVDEVDPEIPDPARMGAARRHAARARLDGVRAAHRAPAARASERSTANSSRRGEVELVGHDSVDWLGVPLRAEGRTLGVLVLQSYDESKRFTEQDKDLLAFIGQHIGTALARTQTPRRDAAATFASSRP